MLLASIIASCFVTMVFAGSIHATIYYGDGEQRVANAFVQLRNDDCEIIDWDWADEQGEVTFTGLTSGTYFVFAYAPDKSKFWGWNGCVVGSGQTDVTVRVYSTPPANPC